MRAVRGLHESASSSEAWKTISCLARRVWQVSPLPWQACDEDGSKRCDLIDASEGQVVAVAWRYEECHRALEAERVTTGKHGEFLETIEYLKTQKHGLMATMQRTS